MRVDYIKIDGQVCILIRDINQGVFNFNQLSNDIRFFADPYKIANEIRCQRKIAAIKEVRSQTGWGLKDAKYFMDNYMPMSPVPNGFDYNIAAENFIRDHKIKEGNFLSDEEMEIR